MASRAEVTTRYAKAYAKASKKDKGRILDQVVAVTGWSRDNARRRLTAAAQTAAGLGRAGRQAATEAAGTEVLLRRSQGAAEGVGCLGWPVREVSGRVDARPSSTGWNATASWSTAATGTARRCGRSCWR